MRRRPSIEGGGGGGREGDQAYRSWDIIPSYLYLNMLYIDILYTYL